MSDTNQAIIIDPVLVRTCMENTFYRQLGEAGVKKAESEAETAAALATQEKLKASIWHVELKERQLKLEATKDALQRAKQLKRPCMTLGIQVRQEERDDRTVFIAAWSGLVAEGDTPEIACSNFDRMWVGGDEEL